MRPAEVGLLLQGEFMPLVRLQQADHEVDPCGLPAADLIIQPVTGTRPGGDRQPAARTKVSPPKSIQCNRDIN